MTPVRGDGLPLLRWQEEEVALCTQSYLGSDIVRSPAESGGRHSIQNPFLAHSKVSQLAVTFCIQKDVIQFQIPARAKTTWLMLQSSQYRIPLLKKGKSSRRPELLPTTLSLGLSPLLANPKRGPSMFPNMREELL